MPLAAAVVVAPQAFDLESSRSVNRDRTGVVDPHFQLEFVCPACTSMLKKGFQESSPASPSARFRQDPHPEIQDALPPLMNVRISDNAPGILEYPGSRWRLGFDHFSESPSLSLEIDGWLGSNESLLRDGGHDHRYRLDVLHSRPADKHNPEPLRSTGSGTTPINCGWD